MIFKVEKLIFSLIGTILIMTFFGIKLDEYFNYKKIFTPIFIIIGFLVSISYGIYMVNKYGSKK